MIPSETLSKENSDIDASSLQRLLWQKILSKSVTKFSRYRADMYVYEQTDASRRINFLIDAPWMKKRVTCNGVGQEWLTFWCTTCRQLMRYLGPMDQPNLQPVTLNVFPALPIVTVLSHMPGSVATPYHNDRAKVTIVRADNHVML